MNEYEYARMTTSDTQGVLFFIALVVIVLLLHDRFINKQENSMTERRKKYQTNGHQSDIDPALSENLKELAAIAKEAGAEGIFAIRGAHEAALTWTAYEDDDTIIPRLDFKDGGVLLVVRFPANDGEPPGIEHI